MIARSITVGIIGDNKKLKDSLKDSQVQTQKFAQQMSTAFKVASVAIIGTIAGIAGASTKAAIDFNKEMSNIATLIPNASGRVNELKKDIQNLAIEMGKGTKDISSGVYQVISAFGDTNETMKITEISSRAAAAGMSTTTEAINLLSAVTKGYGDTSAEAQEKASDLAFMTVKLGQTTFPELSASIGRAIPLSAALKVSQEELFSVMATATGVTGKAAEVSTQLRGALQSFLAPTEAASMLFEKLGYKSGQAMVEQLGLVESLKLMTQESEKTNMPLQQFIGSIEGQTLALSLTGAQYDTFKLKQAEMNKATGATKEAFNEVTKGINETGFTMDQVKVQMEVASQRIGDFIAPYIGTAMKNLMPIMDDLLTKVNEVMPKIISKFQEMSKSIQKEIDDLKPFFARFKEGIDEFAEENKSNFKEIGDSFSGLKKIFAETWTEIKTYLNANAGAIMAIIKPILDAVLGAVNLAFKLIHGALLVFKGMFTGDWKSLWEGVKVIWNGIDKAIRDAVMSFVNFVRGAFKLLFDNLPLEIKVMWFKMVNVFNGAKEKFIEIGTNIVKGLWDGILNLKDWVVGKITEFANWIPNTVKKVLGIASPSKVMYEHGSDTAKGFILGFQNEMEEVNKRTEESFKTYNDNLYKLQQEYNDKFIKLNEKYEQDQKRIREAAQNDRNNALKSYYDALQSRADSLSKFTGIFDAFEFKTNIKSSSDLINSLGSQVAALETYSKAINTLKGRGIGEDLLKELQKQGVGAAQDINTIANMSDEDLKFYQNLFTQKTALGGGQAKIELQGLGNQTATQIGDINENEKNSLAKTTEDWQVNIQTLMTEFNTKSLELATKLNDTLTEIRESLNKIVAKYIEQGKDFDAQTNRELNSVNQSYMPGIAPSVVYNITSPQPLDTRQVIREVEKTTQSLVMGYV